MPPKKRTAGPESRSKRLRPLPPASDLQESEPAAIVQDIQSTAAPGMIQLNLQALTDTIAAVVSAAVKDAMASQHPAGVPGSSTTALGQVEHLVHRPHSTYRYARRRSTIFHLEFWGSTAPAFHQHWSRFRC